MLGKKTLENEVLQDAVKIPSEKTDIAHSLVARGEYPMKRVCVTLGSDQPFPASESAHLCNILATKAEGVLCPDTSARRSVVSPCPSFL